MIAVQSAWINVLTRISWIINPGYDFHMEIKHKIDDTLTSTAILSLIYIIFSS